MLKSEVISLITDGSCPTGIIVQELGKKKYINYMEIVSYDSPSSGIKELLVFYDCPEMQTPHKSPLKKISDIKEFVEKLSSYEDMPIKIINWEGTVFNIDAILNQDLVAVFRLTVDPVYDLAKKALHLDEFGEVFVCRVPPKATNREKRSYEK